MTDFEKLEKAMKKEHERSLEKLEAELETLSQQMEEETQKQLNAQIAEDLALEAALKKEQEDAQNQIQNDPELLAALPKINENGELDSVELQSCLETLIFISDKPISIKKLKEYLGPDFPTPAFEAAVEALQTRYQGLEHGIELVEINGGYQFRTKLGRSALAKKLAKIQTQRLSPGAMETLSIVAYKQPVLKEEIDKIRGVDSSHFIRRLLDRKLVEISGRSELPGRPMLYSTTSAFLEVFGLKNLNSLPPLKELEKMIPASQTNNPYEDDPRIKKIRQLVGQMNLVEGDLNYDPKDDEKFLQEIRERVKGISTTTPTLAEQDNAEKIAASAPSAAEETTAPPTVDPSPGATPASEG